MPGLLCDLFRGKECRDIDAGEDVADGTGDQKKRADIDGGAPHGPRERHLIEKTLEIGISRERTHSKLRSEKALCTFGPNETAGLLLGSCTAVDIERARGRVPDRFSHPPEESCRSARQSSRGVHRVTGDLDHGIHLGLSGIP